MDLLLVHAGVSNPLRLSPVQVLAERKNKTNVLVRGA